MKFIEDFLSEIKKFNGKKVQLQIIQITEENHPLGAMGAMMMGSEQADRVKKAIDEYNGSNGIVDINADLEVIINDESEKLILINNNFDCNCIEIFRPDPPMAIGGNDMSLWWSYHPLSDHEYSQLDLIRDGAEISSISKEGDCHPIRDVIINGISHSL